MIIGRVAKTEPPEGAASPRYHKADLLDSFGVLLPPGTRPDIQWLAQRMMSGSPAVVRALMMLRDAIMAPFGVKTSRRMRGTGDSDPQVRFPPLRARTDRELEYGLDDRHLDVRSWFTLDVQADGALLLRSTSAVWTHNRLGRVYLAVITPFHVAIVRNALHRLAVGLHAEAQA